MNKTEFKNLLEQQNKANLISYLNTEPSFEPFRTGNIKFENNHQKCDINFLADWFLQRIQENGTDTTTTQLEKFFASDNIPGIDILAINGIIR